MNTKYSLFLRSLRRFCLVTGFFSPLLPQFAANGANINWDGTTTGDWALGTNWVNGTAPADNTTTDNAYFTGNGTYTVGLAADRSVARLYVTGTGNPVFDFGSSKLTALLAVISGGNASLTGGNISAIWYQGNNISNSTFTFNGASASITSNGGKVGYSDGAASSNSHTLVIKNGATFTSTPGGFQMGWMNNAGANLTANSNKIEVLDTGSTMSVTDLQIGYITGGTTNTGRQASGNSLVINNGGSFTASTFYLGRIDGTTYGTSNGNTVTVGGTGTGSTLEMRSPVTAQANTLQIGFGGANNNATHVVTNNVLTVNAGGTVKMNSGSVYVHGGAGNALRINGGAFEGAEQIYVDGKVSLEANGSLTAKKITITPIANFGNKSDASARFASGTLNLETMIHRAATEFSVGDNSGTDAAIYHMVNDGVHSFTNGITIEKSDGYLTGNGTIQGYEGADTTLTVNGVLAPGDSVGTINLTGDLVSGEDAVFHFEIGGLTSLDQLLITGSAAFNGTLNVSFLDGYAPELDDSYQLFSFAISTGAFSTLNLAELDEGKVWDTSELYTTGMLRVASIPEPSTLGLLLMSGLAFAGWLNRRRA